MPYIGKQLVRGQNRELDDISGSFNGSNTTFNLTAGGDAVTPGTALQLFISLGGILQNPNNDFSVSGNQIIFSTPPTSGLDFFGYLQGDAVDFNTPADGSITTAKLSGNLTINVGDGSASTPSIQFFGSGTDTGFYSPGADQVAITTGGTGRLFVDASGNVGVATSSPGAALDVAGNIRAISAAPIIYINNTSSQYAIKNSSDSFTIEKDGNERMQIDSSGRLLVGTSTARSNLWNGSLGSLACFERAGIDDAKYAVIAGVQNSNSTAPAEIILAKSRGTSIGSNTLVSSGDGLGGITFQGSDGTEFVTAALIQAEVDGTPGANDMPGRLVFSTTADSASSPTERMRISANGNFNHYTEEAFGVRSARNTGGVTAFFVNNNASSTSTGTTVFIVRADGDCENTNNSYTGISDIRLKENIVDANSQWDDLKALQVRKYNFKAETGYNTHTQIGLVAQEVELVSPGLVGESIDEETGESTKSVNYSVLYMKAVKALQEAMERIEQLELEMAAVKTQLS